MKKVLFVTNLPAPYKISFFNELSQYVDLTVVYERENASNRDALWTSKEKRKFKEHYLHSISVGEEHSLGIELFSFVKSKEYDCILMNGYSSPTEMLAIAYMVYHKIRYAIICDGLLPNVESNIKRNIKNYMISHASFLLSTNEISDEVLIEHGAKKEKIYRYPFSSIKEREIVEEYDKSEYKKAIHCKSEYMVLYIGQMIPRKGIDVLLKATKKLERDYQLYMIGGKIDEQENVINLPFLRKEELEAYYKAADVFVLATREDIWGLVVNESLAYGTPVITTSACGAGTEMIQEGKNGFIVPVEDAEALYNKIEYILKNPKSNYMKNSLSVASNYTIEKMASVVGEVIEKEA